MSKKIGGLGKGLGALGLGKNSLISKSLRNNVKQREEIKTQAEAEQLGIPVLELELNQITANPHQPRTEFDADALENLKQSVQQYGVLQPLLVRKTTKGYEIIAGERRFRAAQLAGLKTVPAIAREYNDAEMAEVAIIENIQRENLNPLEEAIAYQHLLSEYGMTQETLAQKVGRSRSHITNFLRLLKLAPLAQERLIGGQLSMGQAKPLLALEDEALQTQAVEYILANELSVRKVEALVKKLLEQPDYLETKLEAAKPVMEENVFLSEAQDRLKLLLGTNVRIKQKGNKQRLEIDFASQEALQSVISLLEQLGQQKQVAEGLAQSTVDNFTI